MTTLLHADRLVLFRGENCLFRDLSFALAEGESLLIQGPNGSGKTSLLRAVAGLIELEDGRILWRGASTRDARQAFHRELVWFAHRVGFKGDLTLMDNLRFEAGLRRMRMNRMGEVLERLGLTRLVSLPLRSLSAGQQRRVALARLLLTEATLWLVDEPFTNLDTAGQRLVVRLIDEHAAAGGMAIIASHQPVELEGTVRWVTLQ